MPVTIEQQLPSTWDFAKSFFYQNTYTPPVDLSDAGLKPHLLANVDPETAQAAQKVLSAPDVRKMFSKPLSYDSCNVYFHISALEDNGFTTLSTKPSTNSDKQHPFYNVVEHKDVPGYVIKSGADRIPTDQYIMGPNNPHLDELSHFTAEDSLMRIAMAARIQRVSQEYNLGVHVPKKYVVQLPESDSETKPTRKYCVLSEKVDIPSPDQTMKNIVGMDKEAQRQLARRISTLVTKVGMADATFENIRVDSKGKITVIDTEPAGLMVAKQSEHKNWFFYSKGHSVEKCARIGLYSLAYSAKAKELDTFSKVVHEEYSKVSSPKLSMWKITLAVAGMALVPVIHAIGIIQIGIVTLALSVLMIPGTILVTSLILSQRAKNFAANFLEVKSELGICNYLPKEELRQKLKDIEKRLFALQKQFFSSIEGVPRVRQTMDVVLKMQTEQRSKTSDDGLLRN